MNITQFWAARRLFPSRMMETCNIIQHAGKGTVEKREGKNAQFLVSRGDDLGRKKNSKNYIKFYCSKNDRGWGWAEEEEEEVEEKKNELKIILRENEN